MNVGEQLLKSIAKRRWLQHVMQSEQVGSRGYEYHLLIHKIDDTQLFLIYSLPLAINHLAQGDHQSPIDLHWSSVAYVSIPLGPWKNGSQSLR